MPLIQLREYRIEMIDGRSFGIFDLSESPDGTWIGCFEECIGHQSEVGVAVIGPRVRTELAQSEDFPRLTRLVRRCIEEANLNGNGNRRVPRG